MGTLATLVVKLVGDVSGFRSDMDGAGQIVRNAGRNMSATGGDLTRNVTLPIVGMGVAATVMSNQFNEGMANVISLVPSAAGEIAGMSDDVQALAIDMGKSTGDMTTGLYQVISAVGYSGDSLEILGVNATAAAAGLATTEEAIALTSAVTKGYGDTTTEATQAVADMALKTVQVGQTTFPELAASIGRVTPLAAQLGISMEEMFGVMATGAGVTGSASEVSSQFRGVMQSLMAPTEDMTKVFEELNVATGEELIDIYGFEDGLTNIMMIAEKSGKPLQSFIGSIEGQTLALSLAGNQAGAWSEKTQAMREAAGTTAAAFDAQTKGINANGFSMKQAAVKMQVLGQNMGTALAPVVQMVLPLFEKLVGFVQGLIDKFMGLDPQTQKIILAAIGLAAAIGPILMVLGPVVTGFGAFLSVIGLIASPVGLVIAAVVALGVAIVKHFGGIGPTIEAARAAISGALTAIKGLFSGEASTAPTIWAQAFQRAKDTIAGVLAGIQGVVEGVLGVVQTFIATHGDQIQTFFNTAWTQMGVIVDLALQLIQATIIPLLNGIRDFIATHGTEIQTVLSGAWTIVSNLISGVLTIIEGVIRTALAIIKGDWSGAWDIVKNTAYKVWENIKGIVNGALEILKMMFGPALEIIKTTIIEKWEAIQTWFAELPGKMSGIGASIIQGMVDGVLSAVDGLISAVTGAVTSAIDAAKKLLGIHSPSTVFAGMGVNMGLGLAAGIRRATPAAVAAVDAMMAGLSGRTLPLALQAVGATGSSALSGARSYPATDSRQRAGDSWNVTVNVYGNANAKQVEQGVLSAARSMGYR